MSDDLSPKPGWLDRKPGDLTYREALGLSAKAGCGCSFLLLAGIFFLFAGCSVLISSSATP